MVNKNKLDQKYILLFICITILLCLTYYVKHDIDHIIIYLYLIIVLFTGFFFSKKIKSFNDYSVGNKNISFPIILLSFFATQIGGGSTFGTITEIYTKGIIFAFASLGYVLASLFTGYFIAPNFHNKFKDALTVSDIIKHFYGGVSERLSAIVAFLFGVGVLSTQMVVLGVMFKTFLGLDYNASVLVSGLVVIIYSTFGGIWAVSITDVIQFTLLATAIPLLCSIMLGHAGGLFNIMYIIPSEKAEIISHSSFYELMCLFCFCAVPFHLLQPATVQRCLILKEGKKIKKMFYMYAIIKAILITLLSLMALSAIILYNNIDPRRIVEISINNFFPPVLKGITICGLIAVIMSTADSHLNSSSVLMIQNIFKIRSNKLIYVKIASLVLGIASVLIALLEMNIIKMIIFFELLYSVGIGIPLVFAILKIKTSPEIFYTAFFSSFLLIVFFYLIQQEINFYTPILIIIIITCIMCIYLLYNKNSNSC